MNTHLEAIFEGGVFRPLQPVDLPEHQRVTLTIGMPSAAADEANFPLSPEQWQAFCDALDAPPRDLPALRKLLSDASLFDGGGRIVH
jgi:predicted DNA-binding antitoxin AbrB/MazE fold protein